MHTCLIWMSRSLRWHRSPFPPQTLAVGNNLLLIQLSDFWPLALQLWFSLTKCHFVAHGVSIEFTHYCLVVGMLLHDSLWRVMNIVEMLLQDVPNITIKQRPLGAHQMTNYPQAEKLICRRSLMIGNYRRWWLPCWRCAQGGGGGPTCLCVYSYCNSRGRSRFGCPGRTTKTPSS